jgi:hypothetical protein
VGVASVKSLSILNSDAQAPSVPSYLSKGQVLSTVGVAKVSATDTAGSMYKLCRVPSGARITSMKMDSSEMEGFTSGSIGLYTTQNTSATQGSPVCPELFGAGIDFSGSEDEAYDVLFDNLAIDQAEKRIWELMGLDADPFILYDIVVTSVVQSGCEGAINMRLDFVI